MLKVTRDLLSGRLYEHEEEHEQLMQIEKVCYDRPCLDVLFRVLTGPLVYGCVGSDTMAYLWN